MPSSDQVPVKSMHFMMLWPKWVVLIAGSIGAALRAVRPSNRYIKSGRFPLVWQDKESFHVGSGLGFGRSPYWKGVPHSSEYTLVWINDDMMSRAVVMRRSGVRGGVQRHQKASCRSAPHRFAPIESPLRCARAEPR